MWETAALELVIRPQGNGDESVRKRSSSGGSEWGDEWVDDDHVDACAYSP